MRSHLCVVGMKLFFVCSLPLLINAGLFSQEQKTPQKCDYQHDVRTYICKNIVDVFPSIYYGNYHLKCEKCDIPVFQKETFPYDNNLVSLNLTESGLKMIEPNAFAALTTVQFIYMQRNKIKNISRDAFYALRQVYELHLEYNELSELTPGFMNGFEANTVIMAHNKLSEIPADAFEGIFGMMTLDLSHNYIFSLNGDSFHHLKGLEYLDLQHNKLCSVPLGAFKHLGLLKELNLGHNNFKKFNHGMFSGLSNLIALNLSHNGLIEFDASILIPLMKISRLDISANGLNYLDGIPLHNNAPGLKMLGISDNLWSCTGLVNFVQYLKSIGVEVVEHDKYDVTNIKGIACLDGPFPDNVSFDSFYKLIRQVTQQLYNYC